MCSISGFRKVAQYEATTGRSVDSMLNVQPAYAEISPMTSSATMKAPAWQGLNSVVALASSQ
jgi:hypothetical protein